MKVNEAYAEIVFALAEHDIIPGGKHDNFYKRFLFHAADIAELYNNIYQYHSEQQHAFKKLVKTIIHAYVERSAKLKDRDAQKESDWFLSNRITGMSLYVDRFCGTLAELPSKLPYLEELGINLLHLMPVFESPAHESDGGYAVSDFRKTDERFGTLKDLQDAQNALQKNKMYLMLDIVLNHTSRQHAWAKAAKEGDKHYQNYYYFFDDRQEPDKYDRTMPEIFPESSPGNFTYVEELNKWVMTVFHHYQWDLNYRNPIVLTEMLDNIFFYANLGVDILRIDAPAFIWKQLGTTSQNLPQAHTLLQLIKQCMLVATPGMALLGEAIVAPKEIMRYFGTGNYTARECDFAYNATDMALQWDALATGDTRVLYAAQHELLQKPYGTSWINYTRCHDDIGLGFDDYMIENAGLEPYYHRRFLKDYYSGKFENTPARGELFAVNDKTGDSRISGSLASLSGLEKAVENNDSFEIEQSINKILLIQAHSFFIGGIPMIFYGDELGSTNDYSYKDEPGKSYDNRWMHRPVIDDAKRNRIHNESTIEYKVFSSTRKLIRLRKKLDVVSDKSNLIWLNTNNNHVSAYLRAWDTKHLYCLFNFSNEETSFSYYVFKQHGLVPNVLHDYLTKQDINVGMDSEHFILRPYQFMLLDAREYR
jgi:amylosucrase